MPEQQAVKYMPQLRGLVESRVEQELLKTIERMYAYYDDKLNEIERNSGSKINTAIKQQFELFSAGLAAPLADGIGEELTTVGTDKTISVADVPNLPASKITSGTFPLSMLDTKILKTDDNLTVVVGAVPVGGKVTIKDNNGNSVDVLVA